MKKGFVVYFDNCRQLARLPDAACAAAWRIITCFAQRLAEGQETEHWLEEQLPVLPPEGVMAVEFLADNIRRDHQRYERRTEQYIAAQRRNTSAEAHRAAARGVDITVQSSAAEARDYMRRMLKEPDRSDDMYPR